METKDILDVGGKFKIEFDEEKQCVIISTPQKNVIEISDKEKCIRLSDQNKNEIVMNSDGITMSSCKDIKMKARDGITLDADSKIIANAKSDISLVGLNIDAQAKVKAMLKGNAVAELSASGQTTIKGAMVMIN